MAHLDDRDDEEMKPPCKATALDDLKITKWDLKEDGTYYYEAYPIYKEPISNLSTEEDGELRTAPFDYDMAEEIWTIAKANPGKKVYWDMNKGEWVPEDG